MKRLTVARFQNEVPMELFSLVKEFSIHSHHHTTRATITTSTTTTAAAVIAARQRQLSREGSGCGDAATASIATITTTRPSHRQLHNLLPPTTATARPTISPADLAIAAVSKKYPLRKFFGGEQGRYGRGEERRCGKGTSRGVTEEAGGALSNRASRVATQGGDSAGVGELPSTGP